MNKTVIMKFKITNSNFQNKIFEILVLRTCNLFGYWYLEFGIL
jgi:hypothetical protein